MIKEEILEGLKYAVAKGESLPKAMMSFYNAGYSKQDIEESARALQIYQVSQPQIAQPAQQPIQQPQKPAQQPLKTPQAPAVVQRVSAYEHKPRNGGKVIMILLILFLVLLLGILVAVFLFRDQLTEILGNIL